MAIGKHGLDEELGGSPNRSSYGQQLKRARPAASSPLYKPPTFMAAVGDAQHYPNAVSFPVYAPKGYSGILPMDLHEKVTKPYPWE